MKRLIVLTILVTTAISTTGCRRGLRCCGFRGARCAPAPTYTPVPAPPAYTPPACPIYPSCPPACNSCPSVPYGADYGGYGGVINGGMINGGMINGGVVNGGVIDGGYSPGTVIQGPGAASQTPFIPGPSFEGSSLNRSTFNLPGGHPGIDLANPVVPNKPVFSHVMGDRKLQPSETLKGAYELPVALPVESASASVREKQ
jgi:hypothetical protein